MLIKNLIIELLKNVLSLRLVNIDSDFLKKNNKLSNVIDDSVFSDKLWGSDFNVGDDINAKYYKGYNSSYEVRYFELKSDSYFFANNHLMDSFYRCYYERNIDYIPALSKFRFKRVKKLKGICAYLSNTEPQHYGHFLMFVFPLLMHYKKYCSPLPDYYYLGDIELKEFHIKLLSIAGIKKEQIITEPCSAEKIVYCSVTRNKQCNKKYWDFDSYNFVKSLVKNKFSEVTPKKLYISRGDVNWRKVIDEDKLLSYLESEGFDSISMDGKSFEEQIKIFSEASLIVAPHGAALTNLLFCNKDTNVIEIFPYEYPDVTSYVFATYSNCNYYRLEGEAIDLSTKACYRNIHVDVSKLDKIIRLIG